MEMPLVSVIVPMFNTEDFVGDLIGSCLVQTLENFELSSTNKSCKIFSTAAD